MRKFLDDLHDDYADGAYRSKRRPHGVQRNPGFSHATGQFRISLRFHPGYGCLDAPGLNLDRRTVLRYDLHS